MVIVHNAELGVRHHYSIHSFDNAQEWVDSEKFFNFIKMKIGYLKTLKLAGIILYFCSIVCMFASVYYIRKVRFTYPNHDPATAMWSFILLFTAFGLFGLGKYVLGRLHNKSSAGIFLFVVCLAVDAFLIFVMYRYLGSI